MKLKKGAVAIAVGAAIGSQPLLNASANPFSMKELPSGYMVAHNDKASIDDKSPEHTCSEGKCAEGQCAGYKKSSQGKCAEGKCKEGKCAGYKAATKKPEGKCSEGKCKEGKCAGYRGGDRKESKAEAVDPKVASKDTGNKTKNQSEPPSIKWESK